MISAGMAKIVGALSLDGSRGLAAVPAGSCAQVLGVTGASVSVLLPDGGGDIVWRSDDTSARLDDLQFTLGEGPVVDVAATGQLVLEPDLAAVPLPRWPVFTRAALDLGVRAVFAVPLQIGAIRLGVLLAHRDVPGPMDGSTLADLAALAAAMTDALLVDGTAGPDPPLWLSDQPTGYRAQVHQATGMISVQLGVSQAEALIRMRAHAFRHRRALADVASDVVARRLRFNQDAN
jgi:GAF domain-containing protein